MTGFQSTTEDLTTFLKAELAPLATRPAGVLTITGSDCSGADQLEADIKTITLCQCFAVSCVTAITARNVKGVQAVYPSSKDSVKCVLETLKDDVLNLKAVKVGLLPSACFSPVSEFLQTCEQIGLENVVLDPFIVENDADFGPSLVSQLLGIFKYCRLVTPSLTDAEIIMSCLKGQSRLQRINITGVKSLCDAAVTLGKEIHSSILLKGGQVPFDAQGLKVDRKNPKLIYNVLYDYKVDETIVFKSNYVNSENTQGAGCILSSSIASNLAVGISLKESVKNSIVFVNESIRHSISRQIGVLTCPWRYGNDSKPEMMIRKPLYLQENSPFLPQNNVLKKLIDDKEANPVWSPETKDVAANLVQIIQREFHGHANLLKTKFGIDNPEDIDPSPALTSYVNYMEKYKNGDSFLELETALIPCQFGFNPAVSRFYKPTAAYDFSTGGVITTELSDFEPCKSQYESWLQAATSITEDNGNKTLQAAYNNTFNCEVAEGKTNYEHIKKIFIEGCKQEYDFWDECYRS
ncbi:hypothetical protein HII12_001969 [Brettanomyces bruxellensis]|uniref:Uncharacterized protein n=1 Tax=Dekkera bruxellensis TaxID=5007 RepID=A0A8H6EWU8_DEKBR|nr:hypothetical protein HII12_001969 [Brettanomyces bruxellensis]